MPVLCHVDAELRALLEQSRSEHMRMRKEFQQRQQEAIDADAEDLKAIEDLEKDLKRNGGKA